MYLFIQPLPNRNLQQTATKLEVGGLNKPEILHQTGSFVTKPESHLLEFMGEID